MKSWSFSKLIEYERCGHTQSFPYKWKESCEAAQAGIDAHKVCEQWVIHGKVIPPFEGFDWKQLRENNLSAELKIGLNSKWEKVDYKEAWLKIILDVLDNTSCTIIDYKNGRREYNEVKHIQQMQLYACAINTIYHPDEVKSELWYLNEGHTKKSVYTPRKLEMLQLKFHNRALTMLQDTTMMPKPSKSNCKFCNHKEECQYAFEE